MKALLSDFHTRKSACPSSLWLLRCCSSPFQGVHAQFASYRGAGRFSAPRGETLLLFPARHSKTFIASQRARGWDRGESAVGARHIVREHDTTQPVLNKDKKRAQGQTAPGVPRKRVLWVKVLLRAGARSPGEKLARSITSPSQL